MSHRDRAQPSDLDAGRLALLPERILPALALHPGERRGSAEPRDRRGAALLLLVPLRLRFLLLFVAAHLTFGHGIPPYVRSVPASLYQPPAN